MGVDKLDVPPRPLEEIWAKGSSAYGGDADLKKAEEEIMRLLRELTS